MIQKLVLTAGLSLFVTLCSLAKPIPDKTMSSYYSTGWYYNVVYRKKPMTCRDTCKLRARATAESQDGMVTAAGRAYVCKVQRGALRTSRTGDPRAVYGTQYGNETACHVVRPLAPAARKFRGFYCLCVKRRPKQVGIPRRLPIRR